MGREVSLADVQIVTRHSLEDETMRTSDTVSCKLGADSLVHDQLLSFRSYAWQISSKIINAIEIHNAEKSEEEEAEEETYNLLDKDLMRAVFN